MSLPVLRAAIRSDALALAELARRCFAATYTPTHDAARIRIHCQTVLSDAAVSHWFGDDAAYILVAQRGAELLGFVQWQTATAPVAARHPIELKRLYVDAAVHGSGLGQRLFDAVRTDAARVGADLLWLCVYAGNDRARRFYARQGMAAIGQVPFCFVDQIENDIALGLDPGAATP
ncbi:MAG: GNAT family N-acetyltransferase [Rhodanobacteraceae bacterium]|nr:GNAT family N-acetyltransferase [Rhodanobacteraceae bacterium]MBK7042639.1 GNAT family N-acetyltransferase [Rhodanobacteraceae bacterium]MBP9155618.1 GNAT family N-acetyltransferase [Xanthomonadales bacterium]HQW80498.1 GNAT family N-acetyltransferase [Pseudomonadota bacterium]